MKINAINHITVNVKDLEISKAFYSRIMGLTENGFIDMGDHTLTYYDLPGGVRLELIDYEKKVPALDHNVTDTGIYRHFCLEVSGLEEFNAFCRREQVNVTKEYGWVEKLGCYNVLILDPNGVEIELIEK